VRNSVVLTRGALSGQMTVEQFKQQGYNNFMTSYGLSSGWQSMGSQTDSYANAVYPEFTRYVNVSTPISYIAYLRRVDIAVNAAATGKRIIDFTTYMSKTDPS
jgi:hypothetical protein